jgi:hypothetical protein
MAKSIVVLSFVLYYVTKEVLRNPSKSQALPLFILIEFFLNLLRIFCYLKENYHTRKLIRLMDCKN